MIPSCVQKLGFGRASNHLAAGAFDDHVALALLIGDNGSRGALWERCRGVVGMSAPGVRVQLCGPIRVELNGERVEHALPGRQGRVLFAYLLLERDRWVSRDELAALLWPEQPPVSAGLTLRVLLSKLRAAVGKHALAGSSELRIDPGAEPWIDVEAALSALERTERAIAEGSWREAWSAAQVTVSIASRRFLAGEQGEWIDERRRGLEDARLAALERLAQVALELGGSELVAAERCARAVVEAAPYRETGYLLLMRTLAARGNPAEAVRVYDRARTRLRDELGIPPAQELRALSERLLRSDLTTDFATPPEYEGELEAVSRLPPLLSGHERTPLIGRAQPLERLIARFPTTRSSGPVAVTVTGEAGIGKTRLIRELAQSVRAEDAIVLYGTSPRGSSPYQPFLEAMRQFIGWAPPEVLARLRMIDPPVFSRLLPELHEGAGATAPSYGKGDERSGRLRVFAGLTRAIEEAARLGPVLIALDDMHWADPASIQLLAHLLGTAGQVPLLVVVAARPGEAPPALAEALHQAERRAPIEKIELPPLTDEDVEALIAAWAGTGAPVSFARALRARTEGNPLFIGHLLRHLVQAGAIDPDLRRWAPEKDILSLGVPDEVQELLELRMASFDDQARLILSTAAVVGPEFTIAVVERALADSGVGSLDALDTGLRAGLLVEVGGRPGAFRFTHALVREGICSLLSAPRRGRLHLAVGRAIESLYASDISAHRAELAGHFLAAARAGEDPAPAVQASLAAANQARRVFANEQAEAHYHHALEFLRRGSDSELRLQAYEGLGDMLAVRTEYAEAIDAYNEALTEVPDNAALTRARLHRKVGQVHTRSRDADPAAEAFSRAEEELARSENSEAASIERIEVGLDRLTLLYWNDDPAAMRRLIDQIRPTVEDHGLAEHRVRLLHSMLVLELRRRAYRLTPREVALARDALRASESTGDPVLLASARFQLGFSLLLANCPDEALDHLRRTVDLSARTGDRMLQARALTYVSLAHRRLLRTGWTHQAASEALDAALAANTPEYEAIARANLAWAAAQSGEMGDARDHAAAALTRFRGLAVRIPFWMPLALWPLLAVALAEGDIAAARAYAEQLLDREYRQPSASVTRLLQGAVEAGRRGGAATADHLLRALQMGDGIVLQSGALSSQRH